MHSGSTYELILLGIVKTKYTLILFYGIDANCINNNIKQVISKASNWAIIALFGSRRR